MSEERGHLDFEIQELLDGQLDPAAREHVETHLAQCAECRARRDSLDRVRSAVRGLPPPVTPEGLEQEIGASLKEEGERPRSLRRFSVAALLAAAAVFVLLVLVTSRRRDLPAVAARDFERYVEKSLSLELTTYDPPTLEAFFRQRRVGFPTRVFDLSMMEYRLVGGRVHRFGGRTSALFVYRGKGNRTLLCEMYSGETSALPEGFRRHEHGGILFSLYRRGRSTQVFWQEGEVTCVLVSDASPEETLALAFAKAMKATRSSGANEGINTPRFARSWGRRAAGRLDGWEEKHGRG